MPPRVLVMRTAGTNCDKELVHALTRAGGDVDLIHVGAIYRGEVDPRAYRLVAVPGGFTYGDDLGAATILSAEIEHFMRDALNELVKDGGFVLGICNGFQALVKTGLLPGSDDAPRVSLIGNDSDRFECRWVRLRVERSACSWQEPGTVLHVPIAHAEGKLVLPAEDDAVERLQNGGHIALRYVNAEGTPASGYPANPNGSVEDIAGLTDSTGRVLGLMPHPERHIDRTQHPRWTRGEGSDQGEGLKMFQNAVKHFA